MLKIGSGRMISEASRLERNHFQSPFFKIVRIEPSHSLVMIRIDCLDAAISAFFM